MGVHDRIAILRQYEELCFRLCLYLVPEETGAYEAAKRTLLQLAQCEAFLSGAETEQTELLRKTSMRQSLGYLSERASSDRHADS